MILRGRGERPPEVPSRCIPPCPLGQKRVIRSESPFQLKQMGVPDLLIGLPGQRHERNGFGFRIERVHRLQVIQHDVECCPAKRVRAADLKVHRR